MSNEQKNDGSAAFPFQGFSGRLGMQSFPAAGGMTLRDYFAAKALPAVIEAAFSAGASAKNGGKITEEVIANQVYHFADAMLAERAK